MIGLYLSHCELSGSGVGVGVGGSGVGPGSGPGVGGIGVGAGHSEPVQAMVAPSGPFAFRASPIELLLTSKSTLNDVKKVSPKMTTLSVFARAI